MVWVNIVEPSDNTITFQAGYTPVTIRKGTNDKKKRFLSIEIGDRRSPEYALATLDWDQVTDLRKFLEGE